MAEVQLPQPAPMGKYSTQGTLDNLCDVVGELFSGIERLLVLQKVVDRFADPYESPEKYNKYIEMACSLCRIMKAFDRDFSGEHENIIRQIKIKHLESFLGFDSSDFRQDVPMKKQGRSPDKEDDADTTGELNFPEGSGENAEVASHD